MCKQLDANTYQCNGNCASGSIWGSVVYTGDSNIYMAAKHMGYLPGTFAKVTCPGLSSYVSTTRNGVTTSAYGNYGTSFYLLRTSESVPAINANLYSSFEQRVESLKKLEQTLLKLINTHELNPKEIQRRIEGRQKQLTKIEEKIRSHLQKLNADCTDSNKHFERDLVLQMKEVYVQEGKKNNKILMELLNPKNAIFCNTCLQGRRQAMVIPCNHAHFCSKCLQKCLQEGKCQTCETKISGYMLINI